MDAAELLIRVREHYEKQLPFVVFVNPEEEYLHGILQQDNNLHKAWTEKVDGFVMAPFKGEANFIIPKEGSEVLEATCILASEEILELDLAENTETKEKYLSLLENAVEFIQMDGVRKIVLSRKKEIELPSLELIPLIKRLVNLYPTAFRYLIYHPRVGMWCGATPEVLLTTHDNEFQTMSLAGTRIHSSDSNPIWSPKEIEEQRIVTEAISKKLEKVASILKVSKTYNQVAGTLVHLRNDFTGVFRKGKSEVYFVANALHPTPAVCGHPTNEAKLFINRFEGYSREYYTGYLGPVSPSEKKSRLFVNLRCMKIDKNMATLFVGGGITSNSKPQEEWQETENKLATMGQVIAPFL